MIEKILTDKNVQVSLLLEIKTLVRIKFLVDIVLYTVQYSYISVLYSVAMLSKITKLYMDNTPSLL